MTEPEAKMFTAGAEYDRYMGRWSRLLAPQLVAFAGVKDGDRGDQTLALLVMNFIPDHERAIAEMRRVTRRTNAASSHRACASASSTGALTLALRLQPAPGA